MTSSASLILRSPSPARSLPTAPPLLAQAHLLLAPEDGDEETLALLREVLRSRARTHPGHLADLGEPEEPLLLSLWRSPVELRGYVSASRNDLAAWRRTTGRADLHLQSERVLWWADGEHRPTAAEAAARLAHLRLHGPGREAFTLRSPVPPPA